MSIKKVIVKWGKATLNVEVDITKNGDEFRATLASMSHVPQENIQLIFKGKKIENSTVLSGLNIVDKSPFMMVGSVETAPPPPFKQVKFLEELSEAEKKKEQNEIVTAGLKNLGNTCYFNSCLQILRGIPEINGAIELFSASGRHIGPQSYAPPLHRLFKTLNTSLSSISPMEPLSLLWKLHPEFAAKSPDGQHLMQHDAEECINFLMQDLKDIPPLPISDSDTGPTGWPPADLISQLFQGKYEVRMKNIEFPGSPELLQTEDYLKVTCVIETGLAFLLDGIALSLKTQVEKYESRKLVPPPPEEKLLSAKTAPPAASATAAVTPLPSSSSASSASSSSAGEPAPSPAAALLAAPAAAAEPIKVERNCLFSVEKRFAILPPYIVVHMNRFFWKTKEQMQLGDEAGRVKIMRKVEFPLVLDLYRYCTDQLQELLQPRRDELKRQKNALADARKKALEKKLDAEPTQEDKEKEKGKDKEKEKGGLEKENDSSSSSSSSSSAAAAALASAAASSAATEAAAAAALLMANVEEEPKLVTALTTTPPHHRTGMYELVGVITHQGRSAEGGHYLAWVKFGKNYWNEYDDEYVTRRRDSDILKLCGGNDWHMAYLLFYKEIDRVVE